MKHSTAKAACKSAGFNWDRVSIRGPDDCWPWMGGLNRWGYGACQYQGKATNASRAAYLDENGPIADGLVVCHRCDNPACCNPRHLWADTQANNLADCRRKGRMRYATGERHHRTGAKLTPEMVKEARAMYASGISQSEIGRRWGIHSSVISRAVRGENWAFVK